MRSLVQHRGGRGPFPKVIDRSSDGVTVRSLFAEVCVRVNRCRDKAGFGDSAGVRSHRPKRNGHLDGMTPCLWKGLSGQPLSARG